MDLIADSAIKIAAFALNVLRDSCTQMELASLALAMFALAR